MIGEQSAARRFEHKVTLGETGETGEREIRLVVQKPNEVMRGLGQPLSSKLDIQRGWKN